MSIQPHRNIKAPFKHNRWWRESVPGVWVNRDGYTLTSLSGVGWRLADPTGRFLADQLELFKTDTPLTDWADELIRCLTR